MSMTVHRLNPSDRMDGLVFDPRLDSEGRTSVGTYVCPCGARVGFRTSHFIDGWVRGGGARLRPEAAATMDAARRPDPARGEGALDFHCPDCRRPVRILYRAEEFGMAVYTYTVTEILEIPAACPPDSPPGHA